MIRHARTARHELTLFIITVAVLVGRPIAAREASFLPEDSPFVGTEVRIPMRDGAGLAADVYLPRTGDGPFPVILVQTPYNKANLRARFAANDSRQPASVLGNTDYAFVIVDWRGRHASADSLSPGVPRNGGRDGFDTVAWVAAQGFCNGRIGGWGSSAVGGVQLETASQHPPSLTCIAPAVTGLPGITYDGYFTNGVLRNERVRTLGWLYGAIYDQLVEHPTLDGVWRALEATTAVKPESIEIPVLMVGGWYDLNSTKTIRDFLRIRSDGGEAARTASTLVMGPWLHSRLDQERQGELDYPGAVGFSTAKTIEFYDHFLRGVDSSFASGGAVHYYLMGTGEWRISESWPPRGVTFTRSYLQPGGALGPSPPPSGATPSSYLFDPSKPLPTVGGANLDPSLKEGPQNQAFVDSFRDDVLVFTSPALQEDVEIAGPVSVELQVSSDRPDTDFTATLVDVYPDRRQMLVLESILRMRFRDGVDREVFMEPGTVYRAAFEIGHTALTFEKGHRVGLIISSSSWPRYHVNPNDGGPLYAGGTGVIATNTVHHDKDHPSALVLPVVKE